MHQPPQTLTDLLLRDPEHPTVRRLLEERYRLIMAEKALIERLLGREGSRQERRAVLQPSNSQKP